MIKTFLFFSLSALSFAVQTYKDINTTSIPVQVNVFVVPDQQQLTIVNEQGIQQDSIVLNHFVTPDFQGEDTTEATFYVQRGSGEQNQINLSSGHLSVLFDREEISLTGSQSDALDSELTIGSADSNVEDGSTRIKNTVTSRIIRNPNSTLNPNEEYSGDTNMTVIWEKE